MDSLLASVSASKTIYTLDDFNQNPNHFLVQFMEKLTAGEKPEIGGNTDEKEWLFLQLLSSKLNSEAS